MANPVTVNFATAGAVAENHGDYKYIFTPATGPNAGTPVEFLTFADINWSLNVAGDHVMGTGTIGPRATGHTEAKPGGSFSNGNAREVRRIFAEHAGGVLVPGMLECVITKPGLPTDKYRYTGVTWTGDIGVEHASGSLPTSAADFICTDILVSLAGGPFKSLLLDGRDA